MKINIGPYVDNNEEDRKVDIEIDKYDTWSMDHTLAMIIIPMLKQLKETKHGAPLVDNEDVPEELAMPDDWYSEKYTHDETDPHFFDRWDWVIDEMIFAMESIADNTWEEEDEIDCSGRKAHMDRVQHGCELFGIYFQSLWD